MKIHPRTRIVNQAESKLSLFIWSLTENEELTWGEILSILSTCLAQIAKYQIRAERHPDDPDKKGDEA